MGKVLWVSDVLMGVSPPEQSSLYGDLDSESARSAVENSGGATVLTGWQSKD
jgi:hypothetical protein